MVPVAELVIHGPHHCRVHFGHPGNRAQRRDHERVGTDVSPKEKGQDRTVTSKTERKNRVIS